MFRIIIVYYAFTAELIWFVLNIKKYQHICDEKNMCKISPKQNVPDLEQSYLQIHPPRLVVGYKLVQAECVRCPTSDGFDFLPLKLATTCNIQGGVPEMFFTPNLIFFVT